MTEKKITVGIIQQQNTGDIADNKKRLKQHIEQCAAKGAQLVVLQELHNSLYFCQTESTVSFVCRIHTGRIDRILQSYRR